MIGLPDTPERPVVDRVLRLDEDSRAEHSECSGQLFANEI